MNNDLRESSTTESSVPSPSPHQSCGSVGKRCPHCGRSLPLQNRSLVPLLSGALALAAILVVVATALDGSLLGRPPVRLTDEDRSRPRSGDLVRLTDQPDPEILSAQAQLAKEPNNPEVIRAYAAVLLDRVQRGGAKPEVVFELIEALGHLLRINPSDRSAMLSLADLSFNQQAFDQAAKHYERYLALDPTDLKTKARYASSLQFLGDTERSISILKEILTATPNEFEPLAYLAIAYAQQGKKEEALAIGAQALAAAPEKEAADRFSAFLNQLREGKADRAPSSAPIPTEVNARAADRPATQQITGAVTTYLSSHPIAGPKFVSAKKEGTIAILSFRDFPMAAMPEAVRGKFVGEISSRIEDQEIALLRFIDSSSGALLYEAAVVRAE